MRLDWQPVLTLQDAVQLTVDWYRSYHRARKSMREVTERQITDYMDRATALGKRPRVTAPVRAN
jgi:dTDP-D-glucose 4,6-dehydratase